MLNIADLIIELLNFAPDLDRVLGAGWPALADLAARMGSERGETPRRKRCG
jgi:hypothetical protein